MKKDEISKELSRIVDESSAVISKAYYDTLTGLYNRELMETRLEKIIEKAQNEGLLLIFFFLDLNKFKAINDTYGHRSGDYTLTSLADRLRETLLEENIIDVNESPLKRTSGNFLARLSGDEFVILMVRENNEKKKSHMAYVKGLCKKIRKNAGNKILLPGFRGKEQIVLSVSIGVFLLPFFGESAHMKIIDWQRIRSFMLRSADENMYYAKENNLGYHITSYSGDDFRHFN